jgi:hypothetical protein
LTIFQEVNDYQGHCKYDKGVICNPGNSCVSCFTPGFYPQTDFIHDRDFYKNPGSSNAFELSDAITYPAGRRPAFKENVRDSLS